MSETTTAPAIAPRPVGRPSSYTPEMGALIGDRITVGQSIPTICADDDMPSISCVMKWLRDIPDFEKIYARAREARADMRFECLDNTLLDIREGRLDPQAGRVIVDAIKWQTGKEKPKRYGDKLEVSGNAESPLTSRLEVVFVGQPAVSAAPQAPALPEAVQRALPQVIEATATRVEDDTPTGD